MIDGLQREIEELDGIIKLSILVDEVRALRANLQSTQERCNELLFENRHLNEEITKQENMINGQLRLIGELQKELVVQLQKEMNERNG